MRLELLVLEDERTQMKTRAIADWPEQDPNRNLAMAVLALD